MSVYVILGIYHPIDAGVHVTEAGCDGGVGRDTCHRDSVCRRPLGETRPQRRLARNVARLHLLDHCSAHDVVLRRKMVKRQVSDFDLHFYPRRLQDGVIQTSLCERTILPRELNSYPEESIIREL